MLNHKIKMDLIKTIEENAEVADYSDDSDAEVEVNTCALKMCLTFE